MAKRKIFRQAALEQLSSPEQLDQLMQITDSAGWLALLALGCLLVAGVLWGLLAEIPTVVSGEGIVLASEQGAGHLEAILYVSVQDSRQIQPGKTCAEISPLTMENDGMWGVVTSVAPKASTLEDMARILESDTFAQSLVSDGKLIQVRVWLADDQDNPIRANRVSVQNPSVSVVSSGTICEGSIVISGEPLIERMLSPLVDAR